MDALATTSDERLMAAHVAGDAGAFAEIYRRYAEPVLALLRRGWLDRTEAEDLAQQVFLQLHRARGDYRPDRPLRPWLMTIARNVKRDHLRRVRRRPPPASLVEDPPAPPESATDHGERREALETAVARLPATLRRVVELHWYRHRAFADVARDLGISAGAAKVRAHRAYRALRALLAAGPGESVAAGCTRSAAGDVRRGGR